MCPSPKGALPIWKGPQGPRGGPWLAFPPTLTARTRHQAELPPKCAHLLSRWPTVKAGEVEALREEYAGHSLKQRPQNLGQKVAEHTLRGRPLAAAGDVGGEPLPTTRTKSWNDGKAPATSRIRGCSIAPRTGEMKSGSSNGSLGTVGTSAMRGPWASRHGRSVGSWLLAGAPPGSSAGC